MIELRPVKKLDEHSLLYVGPNGFYYRDVYRGHIQGSCVRRCDAQGRVRANSVSIEHADINVIAEWEG